MLSPEASNAICIMFMFMLNLSLSEKPIASLRIY